MASEAYRVLIILGEFDPDIRMYHETIMVEVGCVADEDQAAIVLFAWLQTHSLAPPEKIDDIFCGSDWLDRQNNYELRGLPPRLTTHRYCHGWFVSV